MGTEASKYIENRDRAQQASSVAVVDQIQFSRRVAYCMIAGALLATVFNVLFPRPGDPADTASAISMMVERESLRQLSFLGVTAAFWIFTIGLLLFVRTQRSLDEGVWVRVPSGGLIVGATLFTAATGVGMAATHAASEWAQAGANPESSAFSVAAALNFADDGIWAVSIIVYWSALSLLGIALYRGGYQVWLSVSLSLLGGATAVAAGVPIAFAGPSQITVLIFAALAQLTIIWAVVVAVRLLRRSRSSDIDTLPAGPEAPTLRSTA